LDGVDLGEDSPDAQLFRKACQLVFENQKASTSWLQRQLRIGYNSAARLIERWRKRAWSARPTMSAGAKCCATRWGTRFKGF
jgi:S-DNA-T family DNA segregation ATPase FtsK/SpoIIIE